MNRLIDLEKEKSRRETELEATQAAVAQAKADASRAQDLGDLMRRSAQISHESKMALFRRGSKF